MFHQVIGDTAMILHFVFLALVTFGGFLTWKWPRLIWVHLPVAIYALGITVIGWDCPLTHVEEWARTNTGHDNMTEAGFIDHYLTGVIYPEKHLFTAQLLVASSIAISWIGLLILHKRRRTPQET